MPLFEYACRACGHRFESLVFGNKTPACPSCGAKRLDKQHSTFAAVSASGSSSLPVAAGPCGSCGHPDGPGSCQR